MFLCTALLYSSRQELSLVIIAGYIVNKDKISFRRTLLRSESRDSRPPDVVYFMAGSQTPSSFLKCSAPGFLDYKNVNVNLTLIFYQK